MDQGNIDSTLSGVKGFVRKVIDLVTSVHEAKSEIMKKNNTYRGKKKIEKEWTVVLIIT